MPEVTLEQALQMAISHHQAGRLQEAEAIYRQILALQPRQADTLHLLGVIAGQTGRYDVAVDLIRQAIALMPHDPNYYSNLGCFLQSQGQIDQAVDCYQRAIALKPDYPEAHNNLGNILKDKGLLDQAIACYQRAIALKPNYPEAHYHLGNALKDKRQLDPAIACWRRAVELKPDYVASHIHLGNALMHKGQLDQAIACYQRALKFKPDDIDAHTNLGNALKETGRLDEAIDSYRRAMSLNPAFIGAHDNLLITLNYDPASTPQSLFAEARQWNHEHAEPLKPFIRPHSNDRTPDRQLRIGYVSSDFHDHASAFFLLPLLRHHDRQQFAVTCYAHVAYPDNVTEDMRSEIPSWRTIVGMTDAQVAAQVREDRIDILVDLKVHTANNRLRVFAHKPAPVQATWLGYPGTTGLDTIDYRLTDPYLDPAESDHSYYSEQSIRLPDTFWCYDPLCDNPDVNALPCLQKGVVTFGCLNNFCKVNAEVLSLWAGVLKSVANSRLMLRVPEGSSRQVLLDRLACEGISPQQVQFVETLSRPDYLQTYHRIDIGLDTLPYNGHTTSLDSFWMGVPVVTLVGQTVVGRAGLSQLVNLGLPELIAHTPQQYIQIAAELANDLPRLTELRATLRQRMQASPLMDAKRFARGMEDAYRTMWRNWCMS